jgi:hypothetical protein
MRLFSAREIAQNIAPPGAEEPTFQRIRAWTAIGLLRPYGVEHPGTGRKREYGESEVAKARVLNALADFNVNVGTMKHIVTWLDTIKLPVVAPGLALYLTVTKTASGQIPKLRGVAEDAKISAILGNDDSVLVLDLRRLLVV